MLMYCFYMLCEKSQSVFTRCCLRHNKKWSVYFYHQPVPLVIGIVKSEVLSLSGALKQMLLTIKTDQLCVKRSYSGLLKIAPQIFFFSARYL